MPDTDFKIQIISEADNTGVKSAGDAYKELDQEISTVNVTQTDAARITRFGGQATEEATEKVKAFSFHGREAHHIFGELNRVMGGFGTALKGVVTDAGPLVVILLAIQAAMSVWNLVMDASKAKLEAVTAGIEAKRKALHDAVDEQNRFTEAVQKSTDAQNDEEVRVRQTNAMLDAQLKVQKELLKLRGGSAAQETELENSTERQKIELLGNEARGARDDKKKSEDQKFNAENQRTIAIDTGNAPEIARLNEVIKKLDERIESDQRKADQFTQEAKTKSAVLGINEQGQQQAAILNLPIDKSGETLVQLLHASGKKDSQIVEIVQLLIDHNLNINKVVAQLKQQVANLATTGSH